MSEPTRDGWFAAALTRFERPLVQYARRLLGGDVERARDVVQDSFLRLLSQENTDVRTHLAPWLFRVCRNRAAEIRRKEKRMAPLSDLDSDGLVGDSPSPVAVLEQKESTSAVLALLETLPENQREVLRLKFQHQLSYREISCATGLSESNVGFLIHTGLKNLKERLGDAEKPLPTSKVQS